MFNPNCLKVGETLACYNGLSVLAVTIKILYSLASRELMRRQIVKEGEDCELEVCAG